jgi:glyoxalase-like protein
MPAATTRRPRRDDRAVTPVAGSSDADRQLPLGEEVFLDHLAHFVRDPQAAGSALARAGFAPAPLSIQSNPDPDGGPPRLTGTGNITVMFRRGYVEVLFKTSDTPLARELDAALDRYGGLHLAAFAVADAAAAHARLGASGFRVRPLVHMQRPVDTESGPAVAAFTIARVEPGVMPEGRIQMLTHRTEHAVWQPRWLTHPNGAVGLTDVVMAVADVEEAAQRFARFTGRPATANAAGRAVALERGRVQFMGPAALVAMLPDVTVPVLPFIGAYAVRVASLEQAERALRAGGLPARRDGRTLIACFPPALGVGAWLFVEAVSALPWR